MRKTLLMVVISLLLNSCGGNPIQFFNQGFVPNCEELDTSIVTKSEEIIIERFLLI